MKAVTTTVTLEDFPVPATVVVREAGEFLSDIQIPLKMLTPAELDALVDNFRVTVFERAGHRPPEEGVCDG